MSKTVVFLGAGASMTLGLPMTKDIFPRLLERLMNGSPGHASLFGGNATDQESLRRCLTAILPGLSDFAADLQNRRTWRDTLPLITDVLSAVDYLRLSENAPSAGFTLSELARARLLVERAVFELLVRSESPDALRMENTPDDVRNEWQQTSELHLLPQRPAAYESERQRTVDWLMALGQKDEDRVTLVSTNYDIEVEQELYSRLGYDIFDRLDFGMRVRNPSTGTVHHRPENARFGVYKLHGSLNWLRCGLCDNVYLNPVGAVAYLSFLLGDDAERYKQGNPWLGQLEKSGANMCHCGYRPLRHMIVAPSFVRDVRDPILLEIWRNALEALRQADEWIIVGYSLPPEDVAIRSMFLRAYQGRDGTSPPPRIVVVQGEEKEPECSRYRLLFPERSYSYVAGGLSGYINLSPS